MGLLFFHVGFLVRIEHPPGDTATTPPRHRPHNHRSPPTSPTPQPARAAAHIFVPVLLIHGAVDREKPPAHSDGVYRELKGPKRLLLVSNSGHAVRLDEATWQVIDGWLAPKE